MSPSGARLKSGFIRHGRLPFILESQSFFTMFSTDRVGTHMATNPEELKPNYCMYCGTPLPEGAIRCSQCGKDVTSGVKALHEWKNRKEESKAKHTRICSNCNAIIESPVLLQCPLCGTALPEILPPEEVAGKYVFHGGKKQLVRAQDLRLDPNTWKLREMGGVFMSSLVMFLFIEFAVVLLLQFGDLANPTSMIEPLEPTMMMVLVGSAIGIFLGIYPLIYVYMRKMNPGNKLALNITPTGILLGVLFGIGLYFVLIAGNVINDWLASVIPLFQVPESATQEFNLIRGGGVWEQFLFGVLFLARNVMEEILFRGVLLKGFNDVLPERNRNLKAIVFSALIYAGIFAFLNFSLAFFITNFLITLVLSVAFYLSSRSTTATMIAQAAFSIMYTLSVVGLLPF